jgi:DNA-binding transcriptional regulator LsrR (DeoR family)
MENNAVRDMVNNILAGKEADAMNDFNTAVAEKLTDALDLRKQEVAAELGEADKSVSQKIVDAAGKVIDTIFNPQNYPVAGKPESDENKPAANGQTPKKK